jgi:dihydrofolate reductase
MRASVFIGTSLDGFIAREDGDIEWLTGEAGADSVEDHGYYAFYDTVDALVMGRATFAKVLTFDQWPFEGKPVVVLSSRGVEIPPELAGKVEVMSGTPAEVVARLEARGVRHAYVDGGVTIQRFLAAGLIQRMVITRGPVLIGQGIPLFGALPADVRLHHVETRAFPSGFVQSTYEVLPHTQPA